MESPLSRPDVCQKVPGLNGEISLRPVARDFEGRFHTDSLDCITMSAPCPE
jgi:hypothetical protein